MPALLSHRPSIRSKGFYTLATGPNFGEYFRKLSVSPYDAAPEERAQIKEAIELERSRVSASPAPEPDTELGKQIKAQTDFPTSVINRHVHTEARKLLRKSKPKGKPS
jgi:hypothetical protein